MQVKAAYRDALCAAPGRWHRLVVRWAACLDLLTTIMHLRRDRSRRAGELARPIGERDPMDNLIQDIRYGTRALAASRGVAALAVLTLALGIGANTLMFSLVNGVLLKPYPLAEPDRLVHL